MFWGSKIGTDSTESEFGSGVLVVSSMDEERDEDDRHLKGIIKLRSPEGNDELGKDAKSFMNLLKNRDRQGGTDPVINPRLRSLC